MSYRSPQQLLEAFRDWGIPVRAYEPDGRPWYGHTTAGGWAPIGVTHHHTAGSRSLLTSTGTQRNMLALLRSGYTGLPGPLCHFAPAYNPKRKRGELWLIGWGNVNHAGLGDSRVAAQVAAGTYDGAAPGTDSVDGNVRLYGLEYLHPGDSTPWPDELVDVGHRAGAAIADAHGWSTQGGARSQLEHREWSRRKIDRSWHGDLRGDVLALLQAGPDGTPTTEDEVDKIMGWYRDRAHFEKRIGEAVWGRRVGPKSDRKRAGMRLFGAHRQASKAHQAAQAVEVPAVELGAVDNDELARIVRTEVRKAMRSALADASVSVNVNGKG